MDLQKKLDMRKAMVLDIKKSSGMEGAKAQVVLALDYSGSMTTLYENGSVQELVERILPLGLAFDDNGEVDFYLFENNCRKMAQNITLSNVSGYINNHVWRKFNMGGTSYAPIINQIVQDFSGGTTTRSGGFLGLGKKTIGATLEYPVYVIFITDGENSDRQAAQEAIRNAAQHGIFFQFVGIGYEQFNFLQKLDTLSGRNIDNANFFKVDNLGRKSDEDLYKLLLAEFPLFVKEARTKNMIK